MILFLVLIFLISFVIHFFFCEKTNWRYNKKPQKEEEREREKYGHEEEFERHVWRRSAVIVHASSSSLFVFRRRNLFFREEKNVKHRIASRAHDAARAMRVFVFIFENEERE